LSCLPLYDKGKSVEKPRRKAIGPEVEKHGSQLPKGGLLFA
jgi:hypothetical protein